VDESGPYTESDVSMSTVVYSSITLLGAAFACRLTRPSIHTFVSSIPFHSLVLDTRVDNGERLNVCKELT
jgi:hypothetical protein